MSYRALFEPCDLSFVAVAPLKTTRDLRGLLLVFWEEKFGFTAVTDGSMYSMVGLSDVLGLYQSGALGSDLCVRDVVSRPVAVERRTPLKEALKMMIERRIRRVFISGTGAFLSDREIVSRIFSPRNLKETKKSPSTMLDGTVLDFGPVAAVEVRGDTPLGEAAGLLALAQGGALRCDEGIVSPWDVLMKPFSTGRLNFR